MGLIDNIMNQFQNLGFENLGFNEISSLTPEQIQAAMRDKFELTSGDLNPGMFQSIDKNLLDAIMGKQYSGFLESSNKNLLSGLLKSGTGKKANEAFGGFAGSGQSNLFQTEIKDVYGKGMSGAVSGVQDKQAAASKGILDLINNWREQTSEIAGNV